MYPALYCEHEGMSYILTSHFYLVQSWSDLTCIPDSHLTKERGSTLIDESGPTCNYAFIIVTFNIKSSHNSLTQQITFSFQTKDYVMIKTGAAWLSSTTSLLWNSVACFSELLISNAANTEARQEIF